MTSTKYNGHFGFRSFKILYSGPEKSAIVAHLFKTDDSFNKQEYKLLKQFIKF